MFTYVNNSQVNEFGDEFKALWLDPIVVMIQTQTFYILQLMQIILEYGCIHSPYSSYIIQGLLKTRFSNL